MSWLSILSGLLSVARWFIGWLHDRDLIDATHKSDALKGTQDALDAVAKAKAARASVDASATNNPSGVLRDDDGFKRPD